MQELHGDDDERLLRCLALRFLPRYSVRGATF